MTKSHSSHLANHQSVPQQLPTFAQVKSFIASPFGSIAGCMLILLIAALFSKKPQGKLGKAYWGGARERKNSQAKGRRQVANKGSKVGKTCLYINQPQRSRLRHHQATMSGIKRTLKQQGFTNTEIAKKIRQSRKNLPKFPNLLHRDRTVYFPDCQAGTGVYGAAGTGKSFGVLNPYLRSAIDQGLSIVLYDFKYYEQSKEIVGYAKEHGYNIQIFAPSFLESCTINLLDFIDDSGHGVAAGNMAEVMLENLKGSDKSSGGNEFFTDAGVTLVKGLFLAAKWVAEQESRAEIGDLMTAAAIVALPNLSSRLKFASKRLNIWNDKAFSQLIGIGGGKKDTNVTEGGIIGNAAKVFQKFIERDFISSLCGKSDFNPDLDGKTLVIVGLNQDYREILTPILATVLDVLISRNVAHSRHRKTPLVCSFDEIPSLRLPKLANWLAESRSAGFVGLLGLQNKSQLNETYGEDRANTMMANCATKHYLNPQDGSSAKEYSEYLGEKEIVYWTKTVNSGSGQGNATVSRSEQRTQVPLMTPEEFLKLPQGKAVTISPGYSNKNEAYVPILHDIKVSQVDIENSKRSVGHWDKLLSKTRSSKRQLSNAEYAEIMIERRAIVERLFPEPPEGKLLAKLATLVNVVLYPDAQGNPSPYQLTEDSKLFKNDDIPIYSEWSSKSEQGAKFDAYKAKDDINRLLLLLESHEIKFFKSLNGSNSVFSTTTIIDPEVEPDNEIDVKIDTKKPLVSTL
ncbi:type IV secretion system DNA-binding domain-containing protein [Chamaesiphon sp.]|uniref:type IV secretion system DNA-binding domain-containing protein n=1 Tax=Chamaesiphon sp. TaxID=2814140 RepID=UPI0035932CB6